MGLFSFVKNAGAKLFGKKADAEKAELTDDQKADQLIAAINEHNLPIDSLYVAVEGDVATIAGDVADAEIREKAILVIGNVEGIAEVDDQLRLEVEAPEARFHTVVSGDTLGKISKNYYGDAMKYMVIFEANKPMLKDPDKIYIGQVLRIPELA